ncbi:MAG: nicotinamide-nucleotide amidohydrolase family protein [Wenzhouxiangellaceae bacterium]|nr:nicotinamide-nucleotide amidohydrolase family protein [Wenzhouxiangellaceae bacterium]
MKSRFDDEALIARAAAVAIELKAQGRTLALAESCTGGWIAKVCTDLAGSSAWFERGYVTYSNLAKSEALGVRPAALQRFGAVSEMVAAEMARGARRAAHADWAVAVTGIAGPDGGSPGKLVGTVCFGWIGPDDEAETETCLFAGERDEVRRRTVAHALDGLLARL